MRCMDELLRLYAVTDRAWTGKQTLAQQVECALRGGVTLVQLREKKMERDAFLAEAKEIHALCRRYGVPLIINDDVELALACGADGIHVGQSDMRAGDVRARVGKGMIVGVTAKTVGQALAAQDEGADYLGSGAVFGTSTKADAKPMSLETLRSICKAVDIPVVAIGGVNRQNLPQLAGTGVSGAAIVSGIFAAQDIECECRALRALTERIAQKG